MQEKEEVQVFDLRMIEDGFSWIFNNSFDNIKAEWYGNGMIEESSYWEFHNSNDLINWTKVGEGFNPTNDPLFREQFFENPKMYLKAVLIMKDEATVGFVTFRISGK